MEVLGVIPEDLRYTAEHEWVAGASGGPVGTVNQTSHITVNANHTHSFDFNFGNCETPPD